MIAQRLIIFEAAFGPISMAKHPARRSQTVRQSRKWPKPARLPPNETGDRHARSSASSTYGQLSYGSFVLAYTMKNEITEAYCFELSRSGTAILTLAVIDFKKGPLWQPHVADAPQTAKLMCEFWPAAYSARLPYSNHSVVVSDDNLENLKLGPTKILFQHSTARAGEVTIPDYHHAMLDYNLVTSQARIIAQEYLAAAMAEQRETCTGGGLEVFYFATTAAQALPLPPLSPRLPLPVTLLATRPTILPDTYGDTSKPYQLCNQVSFDHSQKQGPADSYDAIDPAIVAAINARPNAMQIWARSYFTGLVPSSILASLGQDKHAIQSYRNRVKALLGLKQPS